MSDRPTSFCEMAANFTLPGELDISSSWIVEDNKDLRGSVSLNNSNKTVELDDVVQLGSCVHLIQRNEEPCIVSVSVPDAASQLMTKLVIVSEARILELFGICGEYLSTCTAEYVDDFEDCAVYMAECHIKPTKQLSIKFQKAKHPDSLWLYGINLTICTSQSTPSPPSSINFRVVNEMLKETKIPISENAEKCKTFLQSYANQSQLFFKNKPPNPQLLVKMFEAEYFNSISERGKNVSKCFSNFVPFLSRDSSESNSTPDSDISQNKIGLSSEILFIKNYIDRRFTDLENQIQKFEKDMKDLEIRQNEKLDNIIALLNEKSN